MTVEKLIEELQKFPKDFEVYAKNDNGDYRRVEAIEKDCCYDDILIFAGNIE